MVQQELRVGLFFFVGLSLGFLLSLLVGDDLREVFGERTFLPSGRPCRTGLDHNGTQLVLRSPQSHREVDMVVGPDTTIEFHNLSEHKDDDHIARFLSRKVKVLIWVMTHPANHKSKAAHVKATWGKRANVLLFMSDEVDKSLPTVALHVPNGRDHLTMKTMRAFQYVHDHHLDDADWFMKADDDTYVIVENLRYMLSEHSAKTPVYFGHLFLPYVKQGYFSGGGGYVMSKEALKRFGRRKKGVCSDDDGAEDVSMGRCMESLGVKTGNSTDAFGRSRFHCFPASTHVNSQYADWYYKYDARNGKGGIGNMSDYPVTFHYVSPVEMYTMEYFVYHMRPYGILPNISTTSNLKITKQQTTKTNKS